MTTVQSPRFAKGATITALLASGGLAFFATTRPWWTTTVAVPGMPTTDVEVAGSTVVPWAIGVALCVAAGALGVLAGSRIVRRVLGIALAIASIGAFVAVLLASGDQAQRTALDLAAVSGVSVQWAASIWRSLAAASFIASAFLGIWTVWHGPNWTKMSARYDAPQSSEAGESSELWKLIDQGIDPTED